MKPVFFLGLLLLPGIGFSQAASNQKSDDAQRKAMLLQANDVVASATQKQSPSFQAGIWKTEAEQNRTVASAWLNYYLWTDRDKTLSPSQKEDRLFQIFQQAQLNAVQSSEYFLIKYLQSRKQDSASLNKAFELSKDKETLYQYKIQYAVVTNNKSLQRQYALELNKLMPMPGVLYEYHYNVLMSADSNAIIYAQGLNDLVAMAFVQQVKNHRQDIQLKYYEGSIVKEANVYLCLSLGADVLKKYPNAGYSGLLLKISGATLQDLKKSINRFDLRIMQADNALTDVNDAPAIYKNYLPSFLLWYKHLKANDASRNEWRFLIKRLAERTGDITAVEKLLND